MRTPSPGPLIAKGRTADVYAWDENRIIKLFHGWCPTKWVQQEIEINHVVATTTLPTPKLVDVLEIGGRQGIIYDRADGPSMLKLSNKKPWLLLHHARQLAELQTEIHKQNGCSLPKLRSSLRETIEQAKNLPPDLKTGVLRLLGKLPEDTALCHFDFHPDQVLITSGGPVIIDWMTARKGHPLADVARTSIILMFGQAPGAGWAMRSIVNLGRGLFHRTYIARYLQLHPTITMDDVRTWMIPVAAGRLKEEIPGEQQSLLNFIQSYLPV